MNTKAKILMPYLSFCLMTLAVTLMLNCGKDKNENPPPPPPPTVYSNATLTGIWMGIDLTADMSSSFKFDGNGSVVEDYGYSWSAGPVSLPYPYNVQANGSFTIIETFVTGSSVTITGTLTSTTAGSITTVDGSPVTGIVVKKVMDIGACQGTWSGQLAGGRTDSFEINVNNTGTITGGSGFTGPIGGKLFCESGRATGLVTTGAIAPLDLFTFGSGTVVSGATVTISGKYDMQTASGTYTLVRAPFIPSPLYSNATLTGTWMHTLTDGNITFIDSFKFDGNGSMVENYILNPGTLPASYTVHSDGSFTYNFTLAYDPTVVVTGVLTSANTGSITAASGTPLAGTLRKIMDLGACQGTWNGTATGPFTNSFTIIVDNTGTITGGSGFTAPLSGKLFCEFGEATGYLATADASPKDRMQFHTGTVVSGATVTISGNLETNGPAGTYTLVRTSSPPSPAPLIVKGTSGNDVNMNGVWTECTHWAGDQEDEKDTLTINGGSWTMVAQIWSAAITSNCTQAAAPDMIVNFSGSVTTGATGTAVWMNGTTPASPPAGIPANAQATQATVGFSSATVTLQSDAYVNDANANSLCGGGWVKNVARDVLSCTDFLPGPTEQDYWVIDDSASPLKWYANEDGVAWHVDINSIMTK